MTTDDAVQHAVLAVDAALPADLFTPPQGPGDGRSVIWCSSWADMNLRFPGLPSAQDEPDEEATNYACDDLTVEWDAVGLLTRCDLEGWEVQASFEALGHAESAAAAQGLLGSPVVEALELLATLLPRLFDLGRAR